jgi:predicted ATPase/serine/threonine protein kinase
VTTLFAGRYTLMQKLASGGMAEVFLARQHGIEGFEKQVVLKRILPGHSDDPEFVRMFLDEARTAADLNHPNVVNVFDAGVADGTYFMTMEYLRGKDLGAIFHEVTQTGGLPLGTAVHLLVDAARGLHAAHTARDLDGRALGIVHRDISPQNLFATWDGVTKVLDFGIAHAARRGTKTEIGVVKGKIAYLSPEQLDGATLDGRSDQFALGIVAWELLTGKRLFHRPSDAEVLRAILEMRVPRPSTVNATVPGELEEVVLRMLAERRDERFADCGAAADAFETCLDTAHEPHSAGKVASTLKKRFPDPTRPSKAALVITRPGIKPNPVRDVTTRPERKRAALPQEEDFLSAVSEFLHERPERRRSNLVPPSGPFVGREQDLTALTTHFDENARLVTVVAFGGMGKTRLVTELAWRQREVWAKHGGTWFVDLSEARSAEDVCKALARSLEIDVPLDAAQPDSITQAGRTLRSLGRALVVLDNFEQVVDSASRTVGRWLELAPEIHFLVTSRESLRLPGETVYPLAALGTGGNPSEAARLFIARAQLAGRSPTESELATIAGICERLEGHALAIELAAANLPTMSPQQIADRLNERFALLGGRDSAQGRNGTLWATIDWSWQLLSEPERAAMAQLSVFRGGFTPESAIAVMDLTPFPIAPPRLELLASLHRKSLLTHFVVPETPDVLRLRMLESVHQFASEQLDGSGLLGQARARHAAHVIDLGLHALSRLGTSESERAMGELFAERENLSEVFERALSTLPPTPLSARTALRALQVLEPVMVRKGPYASHLALLDEALRVARSIGIDPATLAIGLQQRGNAWRVRGRLGQAVDDLEQALAIVRTTTDGALIARIACDLAVSRFVSGSIDAALSGFEESHALAVAAGDDAALVETLAYLAIARAARNESEQAIAHCDEALPIARARGDRLNEARLLGTMGSIFQDQGRLELASAFLREAVQRCRTIKEVRLQGYFLGKLSHILLDRGELSNARARLTEALALLSEIGDLRHEGLFLTYLATLDAVERRYESARTTLGSARTRLDSVKDPLLLTAATLRGMEIELRSAAVSRTEVDALLDDVRTPRGNRPARVDQSEEVRLAAHHLEQTLHAP